MLFLKWRGLKKNIINAKSELDSLNELLRCCCCYWYKMNFISLKRNFYKSMDNTTLTTYCFQSDYRSIDNFYEFFFHFINGCMVILSVISFSFESSVFIICKWLLNCFQVLQTPITIIFVQIQYFCFVMATYRPNRT